MQVIKLARENFRREISFRSKDKDISLAKVIIFLRDLRFAMYAAVCAFVIQIEERQPFKTKIEKRKDEME